MSEHNNISEIMLTWGNVENLARTVATKIHSLLPGHQRVRAYPIPNSGLFAALAVQSAGLQVLPRVTIELADDPRTVDVFIDDVIETGSTRTRYLGLSTERPFLALVDKQAMEEKDRGAYYSFPWERMAKEETPQDHVRALIRYVGENPHRDGLCDTADRVIRAYDELFAGYKRDIPSLFKTFDGEKYDELILARDVEFVSVCEHHMMPFSGVAHIGYIPSGRILGLSKLARVLDVFARRLQVQERLCEQVTRALDENLKPLGSACVIEASHSCMSCRGVRKQNAVVVTSSLTGVFREKPEARAELFSLLR